MELRRLGSSGLRVSAIVLGCMSYGDPTQGAHPWSLPFDDALPFFERALELGVTTFDTADVYSLGSSEEITGRALGTLAKRDEVVIATKVHGRMSDSPYSGGLSRKHILEAVDASLRRLGTEYIDLYQIHRFDPETPVEETMEALHDVVRAGKVRYLGASSMAAWQFAKLQYTADLGGWTRFVSMQDQLNLLQREEQREMLPFCLDQGVGVLPWSPLARGRLTRAWDQGSGRSTTDAFGSGLYRDADESNRAIVQAVADVAAARGVPQAQIALAWVRTTAGVTAPIVGATKPHHLDDAVASLEIELEPAEVAALESPYTPRQAEGF
jgi:aryl-alcohol dehydrogenase-like predicted oxidoreductase